MPEIPEQPDWLQKYNIGDTKILSAEERAIIVKELADKPAVKISISPYPHQLRDGGAVVFLEALVNDQASKSGATINKESGRIIDLDENINATYVDKILKEIERVNREAD